MNRIPPSESSSTPGATTAPRRPELSRTLAVGLVFVAFLTGLGVGCFTGFRLVRHYTPAFPTENQRRAESLAFQITSIVYFLERLQSPHPTNSVKRIELDLTAALKLMEMNLKSHPDSARDANVLEALQAVKDYRTKFPASKLVEMEKGVMRFLDQHPAITNRN